MTRLFSPLIKKKTMFFFYASFLAGILLVGQSNQTQAQNILLDAPVQAGDLTLFPDIQNTHNYYYLPDKLRLGTHENGKPQFSFLRYVENQRSGAGKETIREGDGGAIVHAVVELSITDREKTDAERELKRIDSSAKVMGPIIYRSGTIALISSVANEDGDMAEQVLGLGKAPLLEGNKAAVSIQLNKKGAKVLWESFKTETPDMSFSFEMKVNGFRSPINARLEADFDQIYKHHAFDVGIAAPVFSGEVKVAFEDLTKNGAIKFTGVQADDDMEKLIEIAYNKLADMMMEPAEQSLNQLSGLGQESALDRATNNLQKARQEIDKENDQIREDNEEAKEEAQEEANRTGETAYYTKKGEKTKPSISIAASYKMKNVKMKGKFVVDLNKTLADNITIRFDENFGNIDCKECFREVNLEDPLFMQRELVASLDGLNANDFGKYINFVTVSMKKTHAKGKVTTDELRISKEEFNKLGNQFKMLYGWNGDNDRRKWLDYEVKTTWSFFGDYSTGSDWIKRDQPAINLAPPFHPVSVSVEAEKEMLQEAGVRLVIVKFYYDYGGGEKMEQVVIRTSKAPHAQQVDFMLKKDQYEFDYEITWQLRGNKTVKSGRLTTTDTIMYVDELPEEK